MLNINLSMKKSDCSGHLFFFPHCTSKDTCGKHSLYAYKIYEVLPRPQIIVAETKTGIIHSFSDSQGISKNHFFAAL